MVLSRIGSMIWGTACFILYTDNFLDGDKTRQEKAASQAGAAGVMNGFKIEEDDLERRSSTW